MTTPSLEGTYAVVTGASRGFGRAVAAGLIEVGAEVVGVGRDARTLGVAAAELGRRFLPVVGDAADPALAADLIGTYRPRTVVLNAGAAPSMQPLQHQTWETFSRNWEVDVRQAFHWTQAALLRPLTPGSAVIAFSSGAAVQGSPLSGGYAGAKSTVRFITSYAADESARAHLGIRFTSVLPKLTPATNLGAAAVAAYAQRAGQDLPSFLSAFGPTSTAEGIAHDIVSLAVDAGYNKTAYLLPPSGGPVPAE